MFRNFKFHKGKMRMQVWFTGIMIFLLTIRYACGLVYFRQPLCDQPLHPNCTDHDEMLYLHVSIISLGWTCRCPQLQTLSLKRTGTASAILQCPRLINLDVSDCTKLSDAGVRAAATACPLLASLDMSNCAYVSDETLREISLVCAGLRSLDASHCPNISLEVCHTLPHCVWLVLAVRQTMALIHTNG